MTLKTTPFLALLLLASAATFARPQVCSADVKLPAIIGDHMVLQQGQPNRIWGWADAGEKVTVSLGDQKHAATADNNGRWLVTLASLPAGGPHQMNIQGKNALTVHDVLVGEVWVCSGQSNMAFSVTSANDPDLETRTANYPQIRLISVPRVGTQEPQDDFKGQWSVCTPQSVGSFSAVGYFFGRTLHQVLKVPVGLIDNSWGGSSCEAWVNRDLLAADQRYAPLLARWADLEKNYDYEKALAAYQKRLADWKQKVAQAKKAGKAAPRRPRAPQNQLAGQHRPANLYNGVLKPIIGYGIRGAIWYQGESNAGRAYQYRHLFPLMIQNWRDDWGQGDFPFYWVQLADFRPEQAEPTDSTWAELREAQTRTMAALPNTGEAVIIRLGEAADIHPKNKQDVAKRLARWALAQDYGVKIVYRSPIYASAETKDGRMVLSFEHVGGGLDTFDVTQPIGFSIAGKDQKFVWAQAKIVGKNKIEVWSDEVANPAAVRYAWADNPVCNVQNREGLPLTPFRTDDWPGVTVNAVK